MRRYVQAECSHISAIGEIGLMRRTIAAGNCATACSQIKPNLGGNFHQSFELWQRVRAIHGLRTGLNCEQ